MLSVLTVLGFSGASGSHPKNPEHLKHLENLQRDGEMAQAVLTYQTALVLEALAAGRHHGFDIMDATDLPSGTIYPILRRLDEEGLVRSKWERDAVARREQRPPRRYYELTSAGEGRLAEARARYRTLGALAPHLERGWKPA